MQKSKKFVLIICEGPTDENALYRIMKGFFSPCEIRFHISHGDPLTSFPDDKNPMNRIRAMVNQEKKKYALKDKDILAVIQITDTDGAYIPDSAVIDDPEADKIIYGNNEIRTKFTNSIITRNRKKRTNVDKLLPQYGINNEIPYRIYFVSRNLEHALYGRDEYLTDNKKSYLADDFSDKFEKNWRLFLSYVEKECDPIGKDYRDSWDKIREGTASLERHTNLNFLFEEFSYLLYGD